MSAPYLLALGRNRASRTIVHIHNADDAIPTPVPWKQRLYRPLLRRICLQMADKVVGISGHTLDTFLAGRPRRPGRDLVHYYGVDPAPFEGPAMDRNAFRRSLGLPEDALILLFGGRMVPEKNPAFAVEVLAALHALEPRAVAVFAGAGSSEAEVEARAQALGVAPWVRQIGWRGDLPRIMQTADWFILPRPEHPVEGFGLAVVEAQLAGLRLLLSRGVADDPLLPTAQFRRLGLEEGPQAWAAAALDLMQRPAPSREEARAALAASPMDMDRALDELCALHAGPVLA